MRLKWHNTICAVSWSKIRTHGVVVALWKSLGRSVLKSLIQQSSLVLKLSSPEICDTQINHNKGREGKAAWDCLVLSALRN